MNYVIIGRKGSDVYIELIQAVEEAITWKFQDQKSGTH
jgi:hypothetical protein